MKQKVIQAFMVFATIVAGLSVQAETLTWYGPDGGLWSTLGNWTNSVGAVAVPQNGDTLLIPSRSAALTLENDIDDLTIARIAFTGTGASVTLTGKAYAINTSQYTGSQSTSAAGLEYWPFCAMGCIVTNGPAVTMKNSRTDGNNNFGIYTGNRLVLLSDVTSDVPGRINLAAASNSNVIRFRGKLTATAATIRALNQLRVDFYGQINVKALNKPAPNGYGFDFYFFASNNVFQEWSPLDSWGNYKAQTGNAFPTNVVFDWNYMYTTRSSSYIIQPGAVDVTIDHVAGTDPAMLYPAGKFNDTTYSITGYSGTLRMRSTTSVLSYAKFFGWFSVMWDPVGDYTLELRDRTHDMKGGDYTFTANRGRVVLGGMTQMLNGKLVLGENAVVDMACTNGIAMPSVKSVTMGNGSRLYITNDTVQAFTANAATLTIKDGAYIEIGDGAVAPSFKKVTKAYGLPIAAGSYTGMDSTAAGATKVPWLRGSAVVTVEQSSYPTSGDNYWKAAVDGDWSDATKWTLGVPNNTQNVHIEVSQCADYKVTVTDNVNFTSRIYVAGEPYSGHKTMLSVKGRLGASNTVSLKNGGVLDTPTNGVSWLSCGDSPDNLAIGPGGELRVSGGLCVLTNNCVRYASFAGTSAKTATVSVASGRLVLRSPSNPLNAGDYAHVDVTGGDVVFDDDTGSWANYQHIATTPLSLVTVSGTGRIRLSGVVTGQIWGNGLTDFSGYASYWNWNLVPGGSYKYGGTMGVYAGAGKTAEWVIRDHAVIEFGSDGRFFVGNTGTAYGGSRSIVRFLSDADHGSTTNNGMKLASSGAIANYLRVGCGSGYGLCEVANGSVPFGSYGMRIGSSEQFGKTLTPTDTVGCTGVVQVTGGRFRCSGSGWTSETLVPPASLIGWGWPTKATSGRPYNGFIEMSGGSFSNLCHLVLGMYLGKGEWHQSGGDAVQRNMSNGLMIGVAGGEGLLELSGGTFTTEYNAYVGGAPVSAFCNAQMMLDNGYPTDRHDAVGVLRISGGTFTSGGYGNSPLTVGQDGDGTVEMVGPNGSFTANCLTLAARSETGYQTHATLRFKLDAEGNVAPIVVKNTLSISADSKLVIDATACPADMFGRISLIQANTVTGDFVPANVTFLGAPRTVENMSVSWRGKTLSLKRGRRGMAIIVR